MYTRFYDGSFKLCDGYDQGDVRSCGIGGKMLLCYTRMYQKLGFAQNSCREADKHELEIVHYAPRT